MSDLYKEIYTIVKAIPAGKVATYGQVARISGNYRRSRIVGYAMAACSDSTVPCHRVIRADGSLARTFGVVGASMQKNLLESEGVEVTADNKVDLEKYLAKDL